MSGNDKQGYGQKRSGGLRKGELSPRTFEAVDEGPAMPEEEVFAEDDQDDLRAAGPARSSSSGSRLNNPTNLTGARRAVNTTMQQTQGGINRAPTPIPARRTGQVDEMRRPSPLPGAMVGRPTRTVTAPQSPSEPNKQSRNIHWLLYVGVGMVAALALWVVGSALVAWGSAKYNDIAYGNPRTFQTNAVVGHGGDSPQHPSHFIALNLSGQVIIIELRAGNPANSINYTGPHFYETDGNLIPITLEFRDVNHDGKPDMLIYFQDNVIVFLNNGTQFIPPK